MNKISVLLPQYILTNNISFLSQIVLPSAFPSKIFRKKLPEKK